MRKFTLKEFLFAIAFLIILYLLSPLEYANLRMKTFSFPFIWIGIPVIGINLLPRKNSIVKMIVVAIGVLGYGLATFFFTLRFLICVSGPSQIWYVSKKDKSTKIVCRPFECYGTTADCEFFKEKYFTKNLKWVTEFNENPIDLNYWRPTKSSEE